MNKPFISLPQPETVPAAAAGLPAPRRYFAIACVLTGILLVVLDSVIANVALPTIARSLQVAPAISVRVVTAYQVAIVMSLLPCAALGESIGYRRVFVGGVALFTVASAVCALAPNLDWLVAARFIQGFGGACVMALGLALLRNTVTQKQLGEAIGWNALTVALTSAAGPTIGAVILSKAGWPWLFAVNIPFGLVILIAGRALPGVKGSGRKLDFVSVMLNAVAFGAFFAGAELTASKPKLALAGLLAAGCFMAALVRREMPKPAPLIPLDLLRAASFRLSVMASICCFTGTTIGLVALPFYFQHGLGLSAPMTGLWITPWPLAVAFTAPQAGRLSNKVSTGFLCAAGGTCLCVGLSGIALWQLHGSVLPILPFLLLCGVGFGLFQTPNNRNMLLAAPRERSGAAGGMQGTARLVGQTAGAVIMSLLLSLASLEMAPRLGFGIAAALSLVSGGISLLRAQGVR